jgi:hypothetical protein
VKRCAAGHKCWTAKFRLYFIVEVIERSESIWNRSLML